MDYIFNNSRNQYKPLLILLSVFCIVLFFFYNPAAESLNISKTFSEISSAGSSILDHVMGIKDSLVKVSSHLIGKKEREKKVIILTITEMDERLPVSFDVPVEMNIAYKEQSILKISPLLMDLNKRDVLLFNNFTGIAVINDEFNYKGQCSSFLLNNNRISLEKDINKINVEGKKQDKDGVFINYVKIKDLDMKNITGNVIISGDNIMNIAFGKKPMHIEYFEGYVNMTKNSIVFSGTIEYLKAEDFSIE